MPVGLHDRSSTLHQSPNATPAWVLEKIETWRRENKWSASRITHELAEEGFRINRRTVTRHLTRLALASPTSSPPTANRLGLAAAVYGLLQVRSS
ncbi:MAG: hypothetical protein GEU94_18170 [Micromonosporaceae bacterium]|nr:hypothetical protein [Micromonosporaceae bacterium]